MATNNPSSTGRSAFILGLFALAAAALLAVIHQITHDDIETAQRRATVDALNEIIPVSRYSNDLIADTIEVAAAEPGGEPRTLYRARAKGEPVAVVMETVAAGGYNGDIHLLVGIYADGSLAGVRVTEHNETPGLGDKMETRVSDWILQFAGLSLQQPARENWALQEDGGVFDQFTGASITPRAIIKAIKNALLYFEAHKSMLFSKPADAQPELQ